MRYLIAGDFHGAKLDGLREKIEELDPEYLISTGDFDHIDTIHQFMEIEKGMKSRGRQVISVPGNHDYYVLKDIPMESPTLYEMGYTSHGLHMLLKEDKEAFRFLNSLVNSRELEYGAARRIYMDEPNFGEDMQAIIIHGGLKGNEFLSLFPQIGPREMFARILLEQDYLANSLFMRLNGDSIMIRGHDHKPTYAFMDHSKNIKLIKNPSEKESFELSEDRWHTITPGAYFDGYFATIETTERYPILRYHQLKKCPRS